MYKGLFGSSTRKKRPFGATFDFPSYGTPGIGDDVVRQQRGEFDTEVGAVSQQPGMIPTQEPVGQQMQPQGPKSFWGGGSKFGLTDGLAGAAAVLSDAFAERGSGGAVGMLAGGRMDAMQRARKAQEAAQARAASVQRLLAAGYKQPQAEAMASGDLKASDVKADSPYRWEDNAGNVWERGPDGQNQRIFTDAIPKMYVQGDQAITIPNPYATQGGGQQRPEIGATLPDPRRTSAQQPQEDRVLTPLQWQGAVQSLGPEQAEAWRRRNGYQIGDR